MTKWLLRALGLLLLTAALLKWQGWGLDPVRPTGWFAHQSVQALILLTEIGLGVWFLSGQHQTGAWLCATALFVVFSCVSFYQGWIGEASCGCFGSVKVNPWVACGIDALAVGLLIFLRPPWENVRDIPVKLTPVLPASFSTFIILAAFSLYAYLQYGSLDLALAHLRGNRFAVSPRVLNLGSARSGSNLTGVISVFNWTNEPMTVVGGTFDCACGLLPKN